MAFDSEEYLKTWRETGRFPKIHDEIADLVAQTYTTKPDEAILDFCGSIGILGQRIQDENKLRVVGAEWLQKSIDSGVAGGVTVRTKQIRVLPTDDSLAEFAAYISEENVSGIAARRCLSDVFGGTTEEKPWDEPDYDFATQWCAAVVDAGVREMWVQGRAWSPLATHPLPHTNSEIACLGTHFTVDERTKNCAYLKARPEPITLTHEQRRAIHDGVIQP